MLTISRSYSDYVKELDNHNVFPRAQYVRILKRFFWLLSRAIITERYRFKIPYRLGYIRIARTKAKGASRPIDWVKTREAGKVVRRMFNLMGNNVYKWKWDKKNTYTCLSGKSAIMFRPVVDWKEKKIGLRGLNNYIIDSIQNPNMKPYEIAKLG